MFVFSCCFLVQNMSSLFIYYIYIEQLRLVNILQYTQTGVELLLLVGFVVALPAFANGNAVRFQLGEQ